MLFPRPCGIKAFPIGSMGLAFLFPHLPYVCHRKETKCRKLCIDGCTIHGSYELNYPDLVKTLRFFAERLKNGSSEKK